MIQHPICFGFTAFLLASTVLGAGMARAASCDSLASLKLPDTTITLAQSVAAGTFTPPGPAQAAATAKPVPVAFCRVTGSIKPTADSNIGFEVWLPQSGWTGRYESVGNGGFAGVISYRAMVGPLVAGSAVASTDDGHSGPGPAWALGHPEKIADYGYRAVHLTADNGKAIANAFYGAKPKYSYFVGCSKGSQEAFMEAQRFPNDFDGIVAGASANQWVSLFSGFAANQKANLASEAGYISAADVQKAGAAIVAACDGIDGVKDGLINDPRQCKIKISDLPLTPAQQKTFAAIHDGPKTSAGKQIYPGYPFGTEIVGWSANLAGPSYAEAAAKASQSTFGNGLYANFVYQDPNWDSRKFDLDKSPVDADKAMGKAMNSDDPNLTAFKSRGGKLLQFHGWADALNTPLGSIRYYEQVMAAQAKAGGVTPVASGAADAGLAKTQEFFRLFLAPGMGHCSGGTGPNQLGQTDGGGDADHDIVAALERWVEKGTAPTRIVATKFVDNDQTKPVEMTRPLCAYPQAAKYKGSGDTNDAANFVCAAP